jgi:1,2-diacylglycerol 3-beta-galactosyltransferase
MRPSALSILSAASVLTSAAANSTPPERYALHNSLLNSQPLPWGVIPSGGEASSQDTSGDYGNSSSSADSSSAPPQMKGKPTKSQSQSSKILDSVHAGGAFQYPPVSSSSSSSKRALINDRQTDNNVASIRSSEAPLSVATNPQNMVETAEEILNIRKQHQGIESDEGNGQIMTNNNSSNNDKGPQKKGPLRILFLSSDTGGGHRASAEALANQFQRLYPGTTYDLLDIWSDIDSSWPYNTIKECYKSFSASPWKWRTLYHVSNTAIYAKFADLHSYYMNEEMIREKIEEYNPDVVVSVHPTMNYIPLFSTRKISDKTGKEIPFFTVVTDFGSGHCTWFNKDVDRMYLASEPIKAIAQKRGGVPDEKIVMSGLPIRYDFAAQADAMGDRTTEEGKAHQRSVREQLNINPNKRMVLVMGGGEGVGSLSDIVNELYAKLRTQGVDATICVVCGRNEQLKEDLQTRCWDTVVSQSLNSYESLKSRFITKYLSAHASRSRRIQAALDRAAAKAAKGKDVAEIPGNVDVIPLGFVKNMAEYMVAADVLVTKAGPGTIAEAAAVGLPIMVTSHLPGQEAGNVDIVLDGGFGDYCEDPETIALEIACWLQDSQLIDVMSKKAKAVGHPHAAEEIAEDIGETTHEWMERNNKK